MFLAHSFSPETRALFLWHQYCWECGCNQNHNGGLEIHHNCGRKKHELYLDSVFNATVLCKLHHDHITGSPEERIKLFKHTVKVLKELKYIPSMQDILFIETHAQEKFKTTPQKLFNLILQNNDTFNW